jgi:uncharacterized protein (DUF2235 family)
MKQAGIGTYFQPGVVSPLFRFAARVLDEAFAWYLSEHIMDGYKFLMQNYHEGDSVGIFGSFNREPSHIIIRRSIDRVFPWRLHGSRTCRNVA